MTEEIKAAIKKGEFEEAKRLAQEIEDEEERQRTLGFISLKAGEYEEAERLYQPFVKVDDPPFSVLYNYGVALFNLNRFDEAIEVLNKALEKKPDSPKVLLTLGLSYRANGELEKARECFEKGGFQDLANEIPKEVTPPPRVAVEEVPPPKDLPVCEVPKPIRLEMEGLVKMDPELFVAFWGSERKRVEEIGSDLWVEGKGTLVILPMAGGRSPEIDLGEGAGQLAVLMNGKTLYMATDKDSKVAYNTVHAQWSPENL
jgi:hypothetical protein